SRRASHCSCANARERRPDPHQPLDEAVLQRAQRSNPAPHRRGDRGRGDVVQCVARAEVLAQRYAARDAIGSRRRARRGSPEAGGAAARQRRSKAGGFRGGRRQAGQRSDRPAGGLRDRSLQSLRGDTARRGPDRVGEAETGARPGDRPRRRRRGSRRGRRESIHREPRDDRRLRQAAADRRARERKRRVRVDPRDAIRAVGEAADAGRGAPMTLWKRIYREKRAFIIPLALGVVANAAGYALWVYPLGVKSAGAADRAAAAAQALQAADREYETARALVAGKSRAEQELSTFYDKVLPADMPSARQLTYAPLLAIARKANVR